MAEETQETTLEERLKSAIASRNRAQIETLVEEVYRQYHGLVAFVAAHYFKTAEDIEDAVGETFLRFVRSLDHVKFKGLKAYLCKIAKNACADMCHPRNEELYDEAIVGEDGLIQAIAYSEDLSKALSTLSRREYDAVIYRVTFEMSFKEAAKTMGISTMACESLYRRAMRKLRNELGEDYGER